MELVEKSEIYKKFFNDGNGIAGIHVSDIDTLPVVDAISVTRCKDCKHRYLKDFQAFCPYRVGPCKPNGFCDRGERKQ